MLSLRRLELEDMAAAAMIHRASFETALPWLAALHTAQEDRAFYRTRVFRTCEMWGAEQQSRLVGIVAFHQDWIDQLYVLPDAQGRGVGRALLKVAQDRYPTLNLWCFQRSERARRFYEVHGFHSFLETDGSGNEEKEPDVLYRWERSDRHLR